MRLEQLGRSRRGMEFKMREQERRKLTHATLPLDVDTHLPSYLAG
jgi:hypothetical protein